MEAHELKPGDRLLKYGNIILPDGLDCTVRHTVQINGRVAIQYVSGATQSLPESEAVEVARAVTNRQIGVGMLVFDDATETYAENQERGSWLGSVEQRDESWDEWARDYRGVESWERLQPEDLVKLPGWSA